MKILLPAPSRRAFSLVEVVLALGLVSFSMLAVVGLLPVGLRSVKNAGEESAAANALQLLGAAIRHAHSVDGVAYAASGTFTNLTWNVGGVDRVFTDIALQLSGQQGNADNRLVAQVEIVAPPNATAPGHARVSIAWPARAKWNNGSWAQAEGSVSSGIIFLPRP